MKIFKLLLIIILLIISGCSKPEKTGKKFIILGFDGYSPHLVKKYMDKGLLPNCRKLMAMGDYKRLKSSMPPQSPVAWSNFITGKNPGGHGIFDFIHRAPENYSLYLSTSKTLPPPENKKIKIGNWVIPLAGGKVELLRKGKAFWEILSERNIPSVVFKVPANFPPAESRAKTISGMGTPDLLGTYGTFSYYTDRMPENSKDVTGGEIYKVVNKNNRFDAVLHGPPDSLKKNNEQLKKKFTVYTDKENGTAKIEIDDNELILKTGEWSDWIKIEFNVIPLIYHLSAICRFYLKEVKPDFKLYVSPLNMDPKNPAMPISTGGYSKELFDDNGYFYTQGMPQETKGLSKEILSDSDYIKQALIIIKKRQQLFLSQLAKFKEGFFFFYFCSSDLNTHMFYRTIDPFNPLYSEELEKKYGWFIKKVYTELDRMLGKALEKISKNDVILVISDHGFSPFNRQFHLNSWLLEQGYVTLLDDSRGKESEFFSNVDWSQTRAYGAGFNGLYINTRFREEKGIVEPGLEKEKLINEIKYKLQHVQDPKNGKLIINTVYKASGLYTGKYSKEAPDLIVGYDRGYRVSDESALGGFPDGDVVVDNKDKWSGDHCMDYKLLNGVIFSNKKIIKIAPALYDIFPTVLSEFKVPLPTDIVGKKLW